MSNVINLNRFRKKKNRASKEKTASENREKFGQSKVEKAIQRAEHNKLVRHIDGHKTSENDD